MARGAAHRTALRAVPTRGVESDKDIATHRAVMLHSSRTPSGTRLEAIRELKEQNAHRKNAEDAKNISFFVCPETTTNKNFSIADNCKIKSLRVN